jgi:hypothetical protein
MMSIGNGLAKWHDFFLGNFKQKLVARYGESREPTVSSRKLDGNLLSELFNRGTSITFENKNVIRLHIERLSGCLTPSEAESTLIYDLS